MVIKFSELSRTLLLFKQALAMHYTTLESFEHAAGRFFGSTFSYQVRSVIGLYQRIQADIAGNLDTLSELRETNNSLLSAKQNEIMKTLTMMALTTFPLTLIAAIFGMDTVHTPILGSPFDFWVVLGMMLTVIGILFAFFKHRGWL